MASHHVAATPAAESQHAPAMNTKDPATHTTAAGPHSVSVTILKDAAAPPTPAAPPAPPAPAPACGPCKPKMPPCTRARLCLLAAGALLAVAVFVAQGILMAHAVASVEYYDEAFSLKGKAIAHAPGLVLATAALALLLASALLLNFFVPVTGKRLPGAGVDPVTLLLWLSAAELALIVAVQLLWVACVGVSARTARVLRAPGWPRVWVRSNAAALALACASVVVWTLLACASTRSLLKVLALRRDVRRAAAKLPAAGTGADAA